jgi:DNA-binding CsgD family transcriptional regulator
MHQKVLEIFDVKNEQQLAALSPRERDALAMISSGMSRGQIAETMKISENTLRVYLDSARNKLGGLNMPHAVAIAVRTGLINI